MFLSSFIPQVAIYKPVFSVLLLQDWQEIVSLYEADNVYLGKCEMK